MSKSPTRLKVEPAPGSSAVHEYPFQVIETHLDVFGHMNNAVYLRIFEEARWDVITSRGFGMKQIQELQQGPVILDVRIQFLKELRNRTQMVIRTWCSPYQGKVAQLTQVMVNERGEDCCQADFTFGLFDLKARQLLAPTPEWLKAVGF